MLLPPLIANAGIAARAAIFSRAPSTIIPHEGARQAAYGR
jgi:hypothetical protein